MTKLSRPTERIHEPRSVANGILAAIVFDLEQWFGFGSQINNAIAVRETAKLANESVHQVTEPGIARIISRGQELPTDRQTLESTLEQIAGEFPVPSRRARD